MGVICEKLILARGAFRLNVDLSLPKAASLALIGPSGSGKSLFLGGLAGFDPVQSGRITLNANDVTNAPPQERPVSMMFQDHNLFPHLSAAQNVGLGRDSGLRLTASDHEAIAKALQSVELTDLGARYPSDLSGGQQSRVALARTLVRNRPILLLDEPFAALGPGLRRDMLALVKTVSKRNGTTTIYVTHDPQEAQNADFAAFVGDGTIMPPAPVEDFFANPPKALNDYL